MVIALAGRRIDAADAQVSRFPPRDVEQVRRDLHNLFTELRPTALVCSAACGADLVALKEAGALGIRRRVVLPFDPAHFAQTSVGDRPGEWLPIYEQIIREVTASDDLVMVGQEPSDDQIYLLTNLAILDQAAELAKSSDGRVAAVLVWDGQAREDGDVTDAFRVEAEKRGLPVLTIRSDGVA